MNSIPVSKSTLCNLSKRQQLLSNLGSAMKFSVGSEMNYLILNPFTLVHFIHPIKIPSLFFCMKLKHFDKYLNFMQKYLKWRTMSLIGFMTL